MLLVQVLKDMRRAGSWDEEGGDALGAQSLFETLDVELATHLAKVRGLGLGRQMEEAFERLNSANAGRPEGRPLREPGSPSTSAPVEADLPASAQASARLAEAVEARRPIRAAGSPSVRASFVAETPGPDVVDVVKAAVEKAAPAIGEILKPVAGAVTSAFGWRRHPITHQVKFHQGVDLRAAYGQEVQSAAAGKVVFSGDQGGYGATVVVEHQDGTRTRYAHLSARLVRTGDVVGAGEPLGRAGKSGRATGTHLHFEVIAADGQRIAPERWAGGRNAPVAQVAHAHAGPADAGHSEWPAGKPSVVAAGRSIKDRSAGAD
jgi:murein DD-endopeptidase MepM/ murein hydrolase activator NlpD